MFFKKVKISLKDTGYFHCSLRKDMKLRYKLWLWNISVLLINGECLW